MKVFKTITISVEEISEVSCNKCGVKEVMEDTTLENILASNNFQEFKMRFGYGSKYDEEEWSFDLCEKCLEEFVSTFKIKPKVTYY